MIALDQRESLYQVGDIVTISDRKYDPHLYLTHFEDVLLEFCGLEARIIQVVSTDAIELLSVEKYLYRLSIDGGIYFWSAEMFEETSIYYKFNYWKFPVLRIFDLTQIYWLTKNCRDNGIDPKFQILAENPLLDVVEYTNGTYDILKELDSGKNLRESLRRFNEYFKRKI